MHFLLTDIDRGSGIHNFQAIVGGKEHMLQDMPRTYLQYSPSCTANALTSKIRKSVSIDIKSPVRPILQTKSICPLGPGMISLHAASLSKCGITRSWLALQYGMGRFIILYQPIARSAPHCDLCFDQPRFQQLCSRAGNLGANSDSWTCPSAGSEVASKSDCI